MKSPTILPPRIYLSFIKNDLMRKMVFIGGPRQVGKTTLATQFIKKYRDGHSAYLNWDNDLSRSIINKQSWPKDEPLIIFDELHKKKGWQSFIKGIWDTWKNTQSYILTGSARLNVFRKGGDSMLGRYHYYRMHPYSLPELGITSANLKLLFKYSGFPEPLLEQDENNHRRWHLQRLAKLIRIDLRDLESVHDLDKVELLAESLSSRVGSLLSYKSFSEDLSVSDKTIKRWIQILDSLYYCYLIFPYSDSKIKSLKKSPKLYLWDWSQIENISNRFENLVASHLLKYCDFIQDTQGHRMELRYLRNEQGKECDFVVLKDRKPIFAVECKSRVQEISENIYFFKEKLKNIPMWYQVHFEGKNKSIILPNLISVNFETFCRELELV